MAKKSRSVWICTACERGSSGWFGKCSGCGAWNTIEERTAEPESGARVVLSTGVKNRAVPAPEASQAALQERRLATGITEFDRVLGGGLVLGSLVLLGGAPGIGKSTLLLQACAGLARSGSRVLYASGEESVSQIGGRATRLNAAPASLLLMAETRIETILDAAAEHKPAVLVVDSIQTVYSDSQEGLPGNISQIRAVAGHLMSWAKSRNIPVLIVGHVTKDGQLAGPRLLEHMVDAVLSFEGDDERATRLLRATKNRFGSTQELGVFEMGGVGLIEVKNPSEAFLAERPGQAVGSCVTASLEGTRPLLIEVQALLSSSPRGGNPRRTCVGTDPARLAMLLAVLERHAGLAVSDQDVFVNVTGGMRLREPAVDLAVLLAVTSSHKRQPLSPGTVVLGEVGLTGEIRSVPRLKLRLTEAARLGFTRAMLPKGRKATEHPGLELVLVSHVDEAVDLAF